MQQKGLLTMSSNRSENKGQPKRLLCIMSSMDAGGAETFLMKMFRNIDRTKYLMDFCVFVQRECYYENEIFELGGKIYRVVPKSDNPLKCFLNIKKIVKDNDYFSVLISNQYELSVFDLIAAKTGGAKKLIYRANSTAIFSGGRFRNVFHKILRPIAMTVPNVMIAPSEAAAEFVFGKGKIKKNRVNFIKNGLDITQFRFDENVRSEMRNGLNCGDRTILIHVGRFTCEKNHKFLIEAFSELCKGSDKYYLVLIGDGPLRATCEKTVDEFGLDGKILFCGVRNDVCKFLQAADIMLLPSLYEGMPNVVIEGQCSGLPCIVADTVTKEANVTGNIRFVAFDTNMWVKAINDIKITNNRVQSANVMKAAGYDICDVSDSFVKAIF